MVVRLNYYLPDYMAINWVKSVDDSFHARFSAITRRYIYLFYPVKTPSTFHQAFTFRVPQELDWSAMQQAAQLLIGEHDFTTFRSSQCQAKTPIRQVIQSVLYAAGDCWAIDIAANDFLLHMIRNIVGSLLMVGKGEWTVQTLQIFVACDRQKLLQKCHPMVYFCVKCCIHLSINYQKRNCNGLALIFHRCFGF